LIFEFGTKMKKNARKREREREREREIPGVKRYKGSQTAEKNKFSKGVQLFCDGCCCFFSDVLLKKN
jgi:hypothetical protein